MSKVLVLGPGATRLGDADAFEMAIGEAVAALLHDGHEVVVVTPRLAAPVCLTQGIALYIEPLTASSVAAIVAKEKPEFVLGTLGGTDARLAVDPAADDPVDAHHEGEGAELEVVVARDRSGAARVIAITELVGAHGIASSDSVAVFPAPIADGERQVAAAAALAAFSGDGVIGAVRLGLGAAGARVLAVRSWYTRGVAFVARAFGLDLGAAAARLALGAQLDVAVPASPTAPGFVVVRVPRFSFDPSASRTLDGTPKSTGESHGVGATFHEAWLKAVRALDRALPPGDATTPCDGRLEHALDALRGGADVTVVSRSAGVRPWVGAALASALAAERAFVAAPRDRAALLGAKQAGFGDRRLAALVASSEEELRAARHALDVKPVLRAVYEDVFALGYEGAAAEVAGTRVLAGAGPTRTGRTGDVDTNLVEAIDRLHARGERVVLVHSAPRGPAATAADVVCLDAPDAEALAEVSRILSAPLLAPLAPVDDAAADAARDAIKIDVDLLCDRERAVVCGVVEYVERAGVHAGDSAAFLPPQHVAPELQRTVEDRARTAALALGHPGAVRVRVAVVGTEVRSASALAGLGPTLPLHARVSNASFAGDAIELALGGALTATDAAVPSFVVARESVLPFRLLDAADTRLGAAMRSTGDAVGFADTVPRAYAKALAAVGVALRRPTVERPVALLVLAEGEKSVGVDVARRLRALGFELRVRGALREMLRAIRIPYQDGTGDPLAPGDVALAIVTGTADAEVADGSALRRQAMRAAVPYVTTIELALAVCAVLEETATPTPRRFR